MQMPLGRVTKVSALQFLLAWQKLSSGEEERPNKLTEADNEKGKTRKILERGLQDIEYYFRCKYF